MVTSSKWPAPLSVENIALCQPTLVNEDIEGGPSGKECSLENISNNFLKVSLYIAVFKTGCLIKMMIFAGEDLLRQS